MVASGIFAVGPLQLACIESSHDCGPFVQRTLTLPAVCASLTTNARKPRQYLQFSESRCTWPTDARPRRLLKLSESSSGGSVAVSCLRGSIGEPDDSSSEHLREDDNENGIAHASNEPLAQEGQPPFWDLNARHKRMQVLAARMGDPLRDIMSSAGRKFQNFLDSYKKVKPELEPDPQEVPCAQKLEWDWERWQKYFIEVEEQENSASILKFQLEDAVADENFQEAARLKNALRAATVDDPVSEVLGELKKALEEERYEQAAKLRDTAAAGLVGWWVGLAEGGNDPYGRIINISSAHGRFLAKGYTARQLSSASPGIPLFEVFIRKDSEGYHQQAVYLQRDGGALDSGRGAQKSIDIGSVGMNALVEDGKEIKAKDLSEAFGDENEKSDDAALVDEGLSRILNFLKERIPDVKLKVFRVIAPNREDIPKIVEQLLEEVVTQDNDDAKGLKEKEGPVEAGVQESTGKVEDNKDSAEEGRKETPVGVIVGGMLQSVSEERLSKVPTRVPARIECQSRDSFLFHIDDAMGQQASAKEPVPSWKVTTVTTQAAADLGPPDVTKVVWNLEKIPVKVSKGMGEILKIAVSQVQKRHGLSKSSSFQRIKLRDTNNDPLNGLYIGAFGPYSSEVVQLRRKHGHWQEESGPSNSNDRLEFFEYVEAVKLTGDLNVPAGQVTFRAKIGRENRMPHRGVYPEELGVVARYKGQGRLAEPGFKNPQWIDGELVLLDGKGMGHINGAELGFVYSVPERHFLVLFNRLKLQV